KRVKTIQITDYQGNIKEQTGWSVTVVVDCGDITEHSAKYNDPRNKYQDPYTTDHDRTIIKVDVFR
ncbi:MAG: hypothetical protein LBE01_02630, partial [Deltaproteobacteria bacterium]|nr:hypothetical protein [Deltaproteobacteria bacterium]